MEMIKSNTPGTLDANLNDCMLGCTLCDFTDLDDVPDWNPCPTVFTCFSICFSLCFDACFGCFSLA